MSDKLTGLCNKWEFYTKVQDALENSNKTKYQIICSNVRSFKLINDLFGISEGDKLIRQIGGLLRKRLPECICTRLVADKFMVLTNKENAQQVIDLFLETKFYVEADRTYLVHIALGIYEIDDRSIPISVMCDRANMALETIKRSREKKKAYFKGAMREQALREQILYSEFKRAMQNQEMEIYLQGLYDSDRNMMGAEALVRWRNPIRGILPASVFVEELEENGLIVNLDQYVWKLACRQLQKWKSEGMGNLFLSVNISAKDFEEIDVCDVLTKMVCEYNIEPEKLRLELTETALMKDIDSCLKTIDGLRTLGFVVEIDDFGSGYSSLNMLKNVVVDAVKLDMNFLQKCKDSERGKIILQMMIDLIKKLEMQVIVEGVETEEQFCFLKEYGCDVFQGFYLMCPMSADSFKQII